MELLTTWKQKICKYDFLLTCLVCSCRENEEMNDSDIIGVIKIKDGLFICDELGA